MFQQEPIFNLLDAMAGNSKEDERFKYERGEIVKVIFPAGGSPVEGTIARIKYRRNAYPEPFFQGYWFPLYFLEHLDGNTGGGEIHEDCLERAGEEDVKQIGDNN